MLWYSKSKLLLVEYVSSDEVLVNMANPSMIRGTAFFPDVPAVVLQPAAVVRFFLATVVGGASTYLFGRGSRQGAPRCPYKWLGEQTVRYLHFPYYVTSGKKSLLT